MALNSWILKTKSPNKFQASQDSTADHSPHDDFQQEIGGRRTTRKQENEQNIVYLQEVYTLLVQHFSFESRIILIEQPIWAIEANLNT